MTRGSLPPLSAKARALLAVEHEIVPQPELLRRRALLRARRALWHAGASGETAATRSSSVLWWRRVRLGAVASLFATSAVAAWVALEPSGWVALEPSGSGDAHTARVTSTARGPHTQSSPATQASDAVELEQPMVSPVQKGDAAPAEARNLPRPGAPGRPAPVKQNEPNSASPDTDAALGRARPSPARSDDTSSAELALLDRARRALLAGNFRATLVNVERHARLFPTSALGEEREALRIRALKEAGLSRKAGEAARDFESRYPKSVLAPERQKTERQKTEPLENDRP